MIIDYNLQVSDAQALTADAASTNVIDLLSDRDIGVGEELKIVTTLDVDMGGTSPTLAIQVQSSSDNSTFTTVQTSRTVSAGSAGDSVVMGLPDINDRYIRLYYDLGGTSPTATVTSSIVKDAQQWQSYPNA